MKLFHKIKLILNIINMFKRCFSLLINWFMFCNLKEMNKTQYFWNVSGILKKYARKLNYEDAEQDLTADFIELIHHIDIEKLNNTSDGAIVNFLIRSTYHYYVKRLQKERDRKVPEVYFEDLTPSQSNLVLVQTAVELEESISGYFPSSGLSEREIFILMAVYTYGYSVSDIAKYLQVSRQNINQIKKRAENKIRQKLT